MSPGHSRFTTTRTRRLDHAMAFSVMADNLAVARLALRRALQPGADVAGAIAPEDAPDLGEGDAEPCRRFAHAVAPAVIGGNPVAQIVGSGHGSSPSFSRTSRTICSTCSMDSPGLVSAESSPPPTLLA